MAAETRISWCDSTWNPWIGCTRVSTEAAGGGGCDHCYAAVSTPARTMGIAWGSGEPRRRTSEQNRNLPHRWNRGHAEFFAQHGRRQRVFCSSLSDWLDNEVPTEWLIDLIATVRATPMLDWLMLSKRIGAWRNRLEAALGLAAMSDGRERWPGLAEWLANWLDGKAPANVWIMATAVNQAEIDRDVRKLLAVPARARGLSIEPMLGAIDLRPNLYAHADRDPLDWVIIGGESGPKARPFIIDYARELMKQCQDAGVAVFMKQLGACPMTVLKTFADEDFAVGPWRFEVKDRAGTDMAEWPEDLRVQRWPAA